MIQNETVTVRESGFRTYQGGYFSTLLSPDQTDGKMAILEMVLPKGAEPPPHLHEKEDEIFYILEGEISFTIDGKKYPLKAGESFFAARNIPHFFSIETATVRLLTIMTPGDLWNYFIEFSEPGDKTPVISEPAARSTDEIIKMTERLYNRYGIKVLMPRFHS